MTRQKRVIKTTLPPRAALMIRHAAPPQRDPLLGVFLVLLGLSLFIVMSVREQTSAVFAADPVSDPQTLWDHAVIPGDGGHFAPSQIRLSDDQEAGAPEWLDDVESCSACHAEIAAEWRGSAHASASFNNPFYRFNIDEFRAHQGKDSSQHCGGCHDVALLLDGAMKEEITGEDERGHMGITCGTCHSAESVTFDGNASFTLNESPIPFPQPDSTEGLTEHTARVGMTALRANAFCASCHRAFLGTHTGNPNHLEGLTEQKEWARSLQAGSGLGRIDDEIAPQGCVDCHMPTVTVGDKSWRSHSFLGGHTALAASRGDTEGVKQRQAFLSGAASIDVAAITLESVDPEPIFPAERYTPEAGAKLLIDVVLRNLRVGHRFPGGTRDLQDTWVEVEVKDRDGAVIAAAGTQHAETGADPTAHRLMLIQLDEDGKPVWRHSIERFQIPLIDHTIPARDAAVVQYRLELPSDLDAAQLPLSVSARLRHRRHPLYYVAEVCRDASSERAEAFKTTSENLGIVPIDPCIPQPLTEIAHATVTLGVESHARPLWRRRYDHAIGWLHNVQERVGVIRPSLEAALAEVTQSGSAREQAMVWSLIATLEARQGRTDDALAALAQADALLPGQAATAFLRAEALAAVWRWCEAAKAYQVALDASRPGDDRVWTGLARSLGSCGEDDRAAFEAARRGLATRPRAAPLLLSQALALGRIDAPSELSSKARERYLKHRPEDNKTTYRLACTQDVEGCDNLRRPVPIYELAPAR